MGQGLLFTVDNSSKPTINVTGGPLSYKYEFHQMLLHFGLSDEVGSEHTIANKSFPAEVPAKRKPFPFFFHRKNVSCSNASLPFQSATFHLKKKPKGMEEGNEQ